MSRTFEIQVSQRVVGYSRVTYHVEAEDFDDAVEKYENGYADHYDSEGPDYWDDDDESGDLEEVMCLECSEGESYCECSNSDDDDDEEEGNPDYYKNLDGTIGYDDVKAGMWIMPADEYTNGQFPEDQLVQVRDVSRYDDLKRISFNAHAIESDNYWYVNSQSRFLVAEDAQIPGLVVAREAAREERKRMIEERTRQREERALVAELLEL